MRLPLRLIPTVRPEFPPTTSGTGTGGQQAWFLWSQRARRRAASTQRRLFGGEGSRPAVPLAWRPVVAGGRPLGPRLWPQRRQDTGRFPPAVRPAACARGATSADWTPLTVSGSLSSFGATLSARTVPAPPATCPPGLRDSSVRTWIPNFRVPEPRLCRDEPEASCSRVSSVPRQSGHGTLPPGGTPCLAASAAPPPPACPLAASGSPRSPRLRVPLAPGPLRPPRSPPVFPTGRY